jgi:hypothetical protein
MGDTWITDFSHFLDEDGSIGPQSGPAKRMAEHLAKIIMDATRPLPSPGRPTAVKCRRRPNRKPCPGMIENDLDPETNEIVWWCPRCEDNGRIGHWEGSLWDCTGGEESH